MRYFDAFAGIGGFALGIQRAGKPVQTPEAQQDKFRKLYEQQKQVTA